MRHFKQTSVSSEIAQLHGWWWIKWILSNFWEWTNATKNTQKLMFIVSLTEDSDLLFRIFYNLYGHSTNHIQRAGMQSSHLHLTSISLIWVSLPCFIKTLILKKTIAPSYTGDNPPYNPSLFIRSPQKQLLRHRTTKSTTQHSFTAFLSFPAACDHTLPLVLARFLWQ